MARVDRPLDLITLSTERNQADLAAGRPAQHHLLRPRTIVYGAIIAVLGVALLIGLALRSSVDINILHDRNPLFVTLSDGSIRNGYTVKILNKSHTPQDYELTLAGLAGATLAVVGQEAEAATRVSLLAKPDSVTSYRVFVTAPRAGNTAEALPFTMVLNQQPGGAGADHETVFRGPAP
jgi:polyferredoxin